ncbi:MAG: hypothetical protein ACE5KM_14760 [Planctomycetaceae bacterium]
MPALVLIVLPLPNRAPAVIDDCPTRRYGPKVEGAVVDGGYTKRPFFRRALKTGALSTPTAAKPCAAGFRATNETATGMPRRIKQPARSLIALAG